MLVEIILLWLDEMDDLVFAGVSVWRRLPHPGLTAALTAAVALNLLSWLALA